MGSLEILLTREVRRLSSVPICLEFSRFCSISSLINDLSSLMSLFGLFGLFILSSDGLNGFLLEGLFFGNLCGAKFL